MMNNELMKLYEKLPKEAIQRTRADQTKKGYDTDGYGYQYCVDRFNAVFGLGWGYDWTVLHLREGTYKSGAPFFEITVNMSIWVKEPKNVRSCVGGHIASTYADALKGAITNAFKKTAAFWGVGADAYRGTIDEDNKPLPDFNENIKQAEQKPAAAETLLSVVKAAKASKTVQDAESTEPKQTSSVSKENASNNVLERLKAQYGIKQEMLAPLKNDFMLNSTGKGWGKKWQGCNASEVDIYELINYHAYVSDQLKLRQKSGKKDKFLDADMKWLAKLEAYINEYKQTHQDEMIGIPNHAAFIGEEPNAEELPNFESDEELPF